MMPSIDDWICSSVSFSSMKPKALLMSSVISREVRGLSLAKISASICGMMFPISICNQSLRLKGGGAADDLRELGGDGSLAGAVIAEPQGFEQLVGIVAGLVHGRHP